MNKNTIFREDLSGYFILGQTFIEVIDRETDNVLVSKPFKSDFRYENKTYTISSETLNEIKSLINHSEFLFHKLELEKTEFIVLDGTDYTFYFRSDKKKAEIQADNLYTLYGNASPESNAGKLIGVVDKIETLLVNNGIDLDGIIYSEEDE